MGQTWREMEGRKLAPIPSDFTPRANGPTLQQSIERHLRVDGMQRRMRGAGFVFLFSDEPEVTGRALEAMQIAGAELNETDPVIVDKPPVDKPPEKTPAELEAAYERLKERKRREAEREIERAKNGWQIGDGNGRSA